MRLNHCSFHNCTLHNKPPLNLQSLLGLGLKFIPTLRYAPSSNFISDQGRTIPRFCRDIKLATYYGSRDMVQDDEGETTDKEDYNPRMHVPSKYTPPEWEIPADIKARLNRFTFKISSLFHKKRARSNLLHHQQHALDWL